MSFSFEQQTLRILHSGDWHLDSPFSRLPQKESRVRQEQLCAAVNRLFALVKEEDVDIVLLPGDLFDSTLFSNRTAAWLAGAFASCPRTVFVIAPGNHDPYTPTGFYASNRLPSNVYCFSSETLGVFHFPNLNADVYGWAFTSPSYTAFPLAEAKAEENGRLRLLCAHSDFGKPLTQYAPVSVADVAAFGAHYAAFGHQHLPTPPSDAGNGALYACSGCIEGRSWDELGIGGAYLITACHDSSGWCLSYERKALAAFHYEVLDINLTGVSIQEQLGGMMQEALKERGYDENTLLRIRLSGAVAPSFVCPRTADAAKLGLFYVELVDNTTPTFDGGALADDVSIRGELYRALSPKLSEGTQKDRAAAVRALRMGLAALNGDSVDDI